MKNPELFHETISILVKAYFEGTLEHGNDCACAVGNLVAAANNFAFNQVLSWEGQEPYWWDAQRYSDFIDYLPGIEQIKSTGYTLEETIKIEKAFESVDVGLPPQDPDGFKGLMSVVDVLQEIHQCTDKERDEAKAQFVR